MLFFYFWVLLTLAVVISVPTVHMIETSRRKKALAESEPDEAAEELGEEEAVEGEEPVEAGEEDLSAYGEGTPVGEDDFSAFEEEFK